MRKSILIVGIIGSTLGAIIGFIEFTIGSSILEFIGNKEDPITLGIVTIILSIVALISGIIKYFSEIESKDKNLVIILAQLLPAVICFTTVGLLWFIPGPIILLSVFFQVNELLKNHQIKKDLVEQKKQFSLRGKQLTGKQGCILAIVGSLLAIMSVLLGFFTDLFSLLILEVSKDGVIHHYTVIPFDFIKIVESEGKSSTTKYFESFEVMITYILLLIGGTLSLISSIFKSRLISLFSGFIVIFALLLFIAFLPFIFDIIDYKLTDGYKILTLGLAWYISLIGGIFIIFGGLFINN